MSLSSKPKKIKPKDGCRELKVVQTVSRKGYNTLKTEEVKTPPCSLINEPSTSQRRQPSSSPTKKRKLNHFESIPWNMEGPDTSGKRQTLVIVYPFRSAYFSDFSKCQNDFLKQLIGHEKTYLNHLLNLEMPPNNFSCTTCGSLKAKFRCLDCYGRYWWCQGCLIQSHTQHPFHQPQQWKDGSFKKISLCDLGYIFQLGHSSPEGNCPEDDDVFGDRQMTIIHVNGIFQHCISFCKCPGAKSEHIQLFD